MHLSATEYRALARVVELGQQVPKNLASAMGMSTGAITAVVDRLVDRGLIVREANAADRRSVILLPTSSGRQLIQDLFGEYQRIVSRAMEGVPDSEVEQVHDALERLKEGLEEQI